MIALDTEAAGVQEEGKGSHLRNEQMNDDAGDAATGQQLCGDAHVDSSGSNAINHSFQQELSMNFKDKASSSLMPNKNTKQIQIEAAQGSNGGDGSITEELGDPYRSRSWSGGKHQSRILKYK